MLIRPVLRSQEAFKRNPKAYKTLPVEGDPLAPISVFLGAYCAGMNDRASPTAVHDALMNEPNAECEANATIRWMLGSMKINNLMTLVAHSGISFARLADHVRFHELIRTDLIPFLNQFAVVDH